MGPSSPLDDFEHDSHLADTAFVPYLDTSESFALGVELGEFLGPATHGIEVIEGEFSARLEAQMLVAASRLGYVRVEWRPVRDGVCLGRFVLRGSPVERPDDDLPAAIAPPSPPTAHLA